MKFCCALILCLVLLQVSKEDTVSTESNQIDNQSEEIDCNKDEIQILLESRFGQELESIHDQLRDSQEIAAELRRALYSKNEQIHYLEEIERKLRRELEIKNKHTHYLENTEIELRRELNIKNEQIQYLEEIETELRRELESKYEPVGKCSMPTVRGELNRQHRITKKLEMNLSEKQNAKFHQLSEMIVSMSENLANCEKELSSHKNTIARMNRYVTSCIKKDSSGEYMIKHYQGFEVLCNSDIAGHGWTVIQQRTDGKVDFYRNWKTYRDGFGDFWDGSFFLGLEKIHRLTAEEPHELYIHMERFNGSSYYARYDEFAIAGEDDQYKLIKLGAFSGSAQYDLMGWHKNTKFSTYDHDNDGYVGNCAEYHHGGWWYRRCASTNLNGRYYPSEMRNEESIYWDGFTSLKQVKMMIRPKGTSKKHSNLIELL